MIVLPRGTTCWTKLYSLKENIRASNIRDRLKIAAVIRTRARAMTHACNFIVNAPDSLPPPSPPALSFIFLFLCTAKCRWHAVDPRYLQNSTPFTLDTWSNSAVAPHCKRIVVNIVDGESWDQLIRWPHTHGKYTAAFIQHFNARIIGRLARKNAAARCVNSGFSNK